MTKKIDLLAAARAVVRQPGAKNIGELRIAIKQLGHAEDETLSTDWGVYDRQAPDQVEQRGKQVTLDEALNFLMRDRRPSREAFQLLPEAPPVESYDYRRIVIMGRTARWLGALLAIRKVELLREKMRYLRERGQDTSRYANMLAEIEQDIAHVNQIQDALS